MKFARRLTVPIAAAIVVAVPSSAMAYGFGGEKAGVRWNFDYASSEAAVNTAKVWNGTNGTVKHKVALDFRYSFSPTVRLINDVVASSRCVGCGAVALGFQVAVVVHPSPKVYAENRSYAYNDRCLTCVTVALAYQFVVVAPSPFELSDKTQNGLDQVAQDLQRLQASKLSPSEIDAGAAEQAEVVRSLLAGDAAAAKVPATVEVRRLADLDPR